MHIYFRFDFIVCFISKLILKLWKIDTAFISADNGFRSIVGVCIVTPVKRGGGEKSNRIKVVTNERNGTGKKYNRMIAEGLKERPFSWMEADN